MGRVFADDWHYLGACRPTARLNMGWFTAPATRSMLMIAKVFGNYDGDEEIISQNDSYTTINVTDNYAPVKKVAINVIDSNGEVVSEARVELKVFNYAHLHSVADMLTDKKVRHQYL